MRRRISLIALPCCLLLLAAGADGAQAARLDKAFWGPATVDGKSQFPIYEQLGVTIYQTTVSWSSVAPTQPRDPRDPTDPAYVWPPTVDYAIQEARKHDMRVLIMLIGSPPWANGGRSAEYAPEHARDFADFARAASRRYPAVRHWMIWGEPSRSNNFKPLVPQPMGARLTPAQARAPKRYAALLDAAYGQLKAQRRSNLVIGGNTFTRGEIRPVAWMRNMRLKNGRRARLDLYGHNPFSGRRPNLRNRPTDSVDFSDLGRFDKQIQRYLGRPRRKRIKLFLSEWTIPTARDADFRFHVSPATQASWITSGFRVARRLKNVAALGWIHLYDEPPKRGERVINGGLIRHNGRRKPGFYAFLRGGLTAAQRAREKTRY